MVADHTNLQRIWYRQLIVVLSSYDVPHSYMIPWDPLMSKACVSKLDVLQAVNCFFKEITKI